MTIDVYSATGQKKGSAELSKALFEAPINETLMHQAVVMQQSNARSAIAHTKTRGEVQGSTRKLYQQKGTGRARRGPSRSSILRGGGKAFGSRNNANFIKNMPRAMRRAALLSCLSVQAKNGVILGLENYPAETKTKQAHALLTKLPVELGRPILVVIPEKHEALSLSVRNIPNVKTVLASYLNPLDVLHARHIVFMVDALKKAEEVFGSDKKMQMTQRTQKSKSSSESSETSESSEFSKKTKKPAAKKPAAKKSTPSKS